MSHNELHRNESFRGLWIIFLFVAVFVLLLMAGCGRRHHDFTEATVNAIKASDAPDEAAINIPAQPTQPEAEKQEQPREPHSYAIKQGPRFHDRIRINPIGQLSKVFNDSNKYQYAAAERLGISPLTNLQAAYFTRRPIVRITSGPYYTLDTLKHSLPFLVPEAERLLSDIGRNFIDSLGSRGADGYRVRVTSLLRTPHTVKKLRRVNRNAVDSSTHQFATTFDISYVRFHCLDTTRTINEEDLKNLLAEVLLDLRNRNRCLVKYERTGGCFHITATR